MQVYLVHFFGVVLLLAALSLAGGGSLVGFLLQQVPCAVIDGDDVPGHLLGLGVVLGRTVQLEFTEDLTADGLDPLLFELLHVQSAASG